jgi:glutathione S-transferase
MQWIAELLLQSGTVANQMRFLMTKLYYSPGACSLSPHIALREAGLSFDLEQVNLKEKKTKSGNDFLKINPKGYVPALELADGYLLTEGPAIVQWIADQNPSSHLAPANGTPERYKLQEWLTYIGTEIHKNFSPLFSPTSVDATKNAARENLVKRFAYVDERLDGKDYLTGSQFTVADAYLFTVTNWANYVQFDLKDYANLRAFQARVAARPKVQEALKAEGLLK